MGDEVGTVVGTDVGLAEGTNVGDALGIDVGTTSIKAVLMDALSMA